MQLRISKPIEELRDMAYQEVKDKLYNHITKISGYPEYKQVNYMEEMQETTNGERYTYLVAVREWKKKLLANNAKVKEEIYSSLNASELYTAKSNMVYTLIPKIVRGGLNES